MKSIFTGLAAAFLILSLSASPLCAHPGHSGSEEGYLVFWKGIPPKSGTAFAAAAKAPDFWRFAFVSKYRIIGASLPNLGN
jgi:hypothetical protein